MGIARKIFQHLHWPAKRPLRIYNPLALAHVIQQTRKVIAFGQMFQLAMKDQPVLARLQP
jgi:hypothetical protein